MREHWGSAKILVPFTGIAMAALPVASSPATLAGDDLQDWATSNSFALASADPAILYADYAFSDHWIAEEGSAEPARTGLRLREADKRRVSNLAGECFLTFPTNGAAPTLSLSDRVDRAILGMKETAVAYSTTAMMLAGLGGLRFAGHRRRRTREARIAMI